MDTMVTILRAAHCKSTHHYFAIDSLWEVSTPRGIELADLLLANYSEYLKGAKDPDNIFKDFENHVVHVADGYWGGAAKAGKKWLNNVYGLLNAGDWKEAAYAIGVLSHYFTDPFMPLHTAQSPRETVIHRPLEWSVCCAYQEIHQVAMSDTDLVPFDLPKGLEWLTDAIHRGAGIAHQYYEMLLDDYDMNEARRFPKVALGKDSKHALAQLFVTVQTGWGSALDRIAAESTVTFPKVSLTLSALLAGVKVPIKKIAQAIESAEHRKEVEKILDEYQRTGTVVQNVSPEQRKVQAVRKLKPELRPAPLDIERAMIEAPISVAAFKPDPVLMKTELIALATHFDSATFCPIAPETIAAPKISIDADPTPTTSVLTSPPQEPSSDRKQLTLDSPIVDAPAIGPKTAARFDAIGCYTIAMFLDRTAEEIEEKLNVKWITARLVTQWQDQSRLSIQIKRLTAAGAGLLVHMGIHSAEQLAKQDSSQLHVQLLSLSQTNEGKRLTRDQAPPTLVNVERWIASARLRLAIKCFGKQVG